MNIKSFAAVLTICLLTVSCATKPATTAMPKEAPLAPLVPKQQAISGLVELLATISDIRSLDFSKEKYETESEFLSRIKTHYERYDGRRFVVPVRCSLAIEDGKELLSYNVEIETATLRFPEMNIEGIVLKQGTTITFPDLRYSFIPTTEPKTHTSTYSASNAFGRTIEVIKQERDRVGLAILTAGTQLFKGPTEFRNVDAWMRSLPKPLEISFPIPRDVARSSLDGCIVNLDVQVQYAGIWQSHQQQFVSRQEHARTMLFVHTTKRNPTIASPVDLRTRDEGLPVDLLGFSVVSPNGKQLLSKIYY